MTCALTTSVRRFVLHVEQAPEAAVLLLEGLELADALLEAGVL
jgi:hypothetical protein